MKRNSNYKPDFRKLLGDVKQWKEYSELALEQLVESPWGIVDTDG